MELCDVVVRLLRAGARAEGVSEADTAALESYVRTLAGGAGRQQTPEQANRAKKMFLAEGIMPLGERPSRVTKAQRKREERERARQEDVEKWHGERPLLPSEQRELAPYEPSPPSDGRRR